MSSALSYVKTTFLHFDRSMLSIFVSKTALSSVPQTAHIPYCFLTCKVCILDGTASKSIPLSILSMLYVLPDPGGATNSILFSVNSFSNSTEFNFFLYFISTIFKSLSLNSFEFSMYSFMIFIFLTPFLLFLVYVRFLICQIFQKIELF